MSKTFVLKLLKELSANAKADGNICKTYNNSAKHEKLKAYTGIDYPSLDDAQWWKQIYESRGETVTIEEL